VFAIELAALTLVQSAASYVTARLLDGFHLDPRHVAIGCGLVLWIPGAVWGMKALSGARLRQK
jgi:hypothetical protein